MTTGERTVARGGILVAAVVATGTLALGMRSSMPFTSAAESPVDPTLCVSTVLPDAYYQAIAELNACEGMAVGVEIAPADTHWAVPGDVPPSGAERIRVAP